MTAHSDRMSIEKARRLTDGGVHTIHGGQVIPAARTIVALSDRIAELEAELSAVAAHSLTQSKRLRAQSQQLDRVQEALHRIERADEQAQHDWDTKADMLAQGTAMGYSMSAQWLEEALGGTE